MANNDYLTKSVNGNGLEQFARTFIANLKNWTWLTNLFNSKQEVLISGTNIKSVNNQSLLGSGNITIQPGSTVDPYSGNPYMDGEANPGASNDYSRGDHRHPTDTSRAPIASPSFTGTPTAPTPEHGDGGGAGTNKIATTAFVAGELSYIDERVDELEERVTRIYKFKGSVATWNDLPSSGMEAGDTYNVEEAHAYGGKVYPADTNWAWVVVPSPGTSYWAPAGGNIDIDFITNSDAQTIATNAFNGELPNS